ncbi:MAG: YlmH/Sll1252 family protein [Firmicutes bacterium]|nr:YlmH/Sll1252 family protein [Bacillota bacterium]
MTDPYANASPEGWARLRELAVRSLDEWRPVLTDFMSPAQRAGLESLAAKVGTSVSMWGGYPEAERVRAIFAPDADMGVERELFALGCVRVDLPSDDVGPGRQPLRHGDLLGATLALGVDRGRIGDLVFQDTRAYIFCTDPLVRFLESNLTQAGRYRIQPVAQDISRLPDMAAPKIAVTAIALMNLRLDACVSHAFGVARSEADEWIRRGQVSLNHVPCTHRDGRVAAGDVIAVRGRGRIKLLEITGTSRGGRTWVSIGRYT